MGGNRLRLAGTAAGDFPPVPQVPGEGELVDGDRFFKALLGAVLYAARPKETARPVLQSVCVTLGDPVSVAGGDGFRLAWQDAPVRLTGEGSGLKQLLVPRESVQALDQAWKRAIKPPSAGPAGEGSAFSGLDQGPSLETARMAVARRVMRVRMKGGQASFQFGEATLHTQLVQGQFPNYQQLIPEDLPNKVTFDAEAAYRAVRMLAPMSAGKQGSNNLLLEWTDQAMQLSARSEEQGGISGSVPITMHGEPSHIAFNIRYLLEYLAGKHGLVLMESISQSQPARFTHPGSANMVLMPMFVKDGASPPASPTEVGANPADAEHTEELAAAPPRLEHVGNAPAQPAGERKPTEEGHGIESVPEESSAKQETAADRGGTTSPTRSRPKSRRRPSPPL
ncbi:MAG TPA: DNA polymerase III subunit beta [Dehalococcoidia bacterium]|nr:DNA polymerase III subunit beta [Dehalococcoidia bacterium]